LQSVLPGTDEQSVRALALKPALSSCQPRTTRVTGRCSQVQRTPYPLTLPMGAPGAQYETYGCEYQRPMCEVAPCVYTGIIPV
jgi:hypothetical protein